MGNIVSRGNLFPPVVVDEIFSKARGKSSLARLSGAEPIPFNGETVFTFSLDSEVDLVAENGAKSNGGATIAPVTIIPQKVEYGFRVSDEFKYASEEKRVQTIKAFADGFARKVARGLDVMAFHGVNPRTGIKAAVLNDKNFDDLITNVVAYDADIPQDNITSAIALVGDEIDVNGLAISPAMKTALASLKAAKDSNVPLFPNLGWGSTLTELNGLPTDANTTVSFRGNADRAIVGNFADYFKWGFAKEIPMEMIEYGDPDNSGYDLKGHNQVYLRCEAYIGWGILDKDAFASVKANASA